jgi:two-component system, OmpR family, phosphate regulon sensor histidine kinase PhoR
VSLGIRTKLLLVSLGLILVSVAAADLYLARRLVPAVREQTREDLFVRAALIARAASQATFPLDDLAAWDGLADSLGVAAHARVTIIGRDGRVIGDSEVEPSRLDRVENHAGRPEVIEALTQGHGSSTRWSDTVHHGMLYAALPFFRGGEAAGVVRAAVPLVQVAQTAGRFRALVLVASALALLFAALLAGLAASWMSRSVRSLTAVARRMAEGELDVPIETSGGDEVAELARALRHLGTSLGRTLELLRAERDLQERILTDMREGVLLLDPAGRVALVNPALREMLLLGNKAAGLPPLEVIRNAEIHALIEGARRSGSTQSAEIEVMGHRPRRLFVQVAPLSGAPGGLLAVFVDLTDLRRLETVRKDFVANVSHELRTPVTAIRSAAETLRGAARRDPQTAEAMGEIIERNAERLGQLIQDLLDLSRIEAREFHFLLEDVPVAPLAEHVCSLYRDGAEARKIRLACAVPPEIPPARADRRACEQILSNLVDNAIKYSPEGAEVIILAEAEGSGIRLTVQDTGPGIEERHLSRIFERFYRVDPGRSRDLGGTGLGLSIVRHLAEGMGGSVRVESVLGQGSAFHVSLPRA